MKIYTKTGDEGETGLFAGGRVSKTHPRVEAYGAVDELNAVLGVVRAHGASAEAWLVQVQNDLFYLGADLATPLSATADWIVRIQPEAITWLEDRIDEMTDALPELTNFILPGGCPAAAHLQMARTVCRRAERDCVRLHDQEPVNEQALIYLNRLSDFLFTLARYENMQAGVEEQKWVVRNA